MEDAATAEISRSQIWQWIHSQAITDTGELITFDWVKEMLAEEFEKMPRFDADRFDDALEIFEAVALGENFPAFLTTSAYANYLHETPEPTPVGERELAAV
jgi:malate synthase